MSAGDKLLQGMVNDGGATTTTITSAGTGPTLDFVDGGVRMTRNPLADLPTHPPVGTVALDDQSNMMVSGLDGEGEPVAGWLYQAAWATMTIPIQPQRILDTRDIAGWFYILAGVENIHYGKLKGGTSLTVSVAWAVQPDAILGNLTVAGTEGPGFITMWGPGARPATSSLNFWEKNQILSNFVESAVDNDHSDGVVHIYASATTAIVFDVSGFVVPGRWQVLAA